MNNETPRIRSLLRQAKRNVDAGKFAAAEDVYRQIIQEEPESSVAWLGLAQVTTNQDEKEKAFEQALILDKDNEQALNGLRMLQGESNESQVSLVDVEKGNTSSVYVETSVAGKTLHDEDPEHALGEDFNHPLQQDLDLELFCYRHPNRSTSLRCYKCNKPICSECTVKTPVGYLCPTCHKEAEDAFFNNKATDYLLAALVALPLSLLTGWLVVRFSGGIFMILIFIFAGGAVGGFIARLSKRVIDKRRGRFIPHVVAACIIIGVLVWALPWIVVLFAGAGGVLFKLAGIGVYLFTAASSAFYWAR